MDNNHNNRDEVLNNYFLATAELDRLRGEWPVVATEQTLLSGEIARLTQQVSDLAEAYLETLPEWSISRCPYTGQLVRYTVDSYGLGGLWWRHAESVRKTATAPDTLFAIDGSMRISNPVDKAPFTVFPGPDKPFVIPQLLQLPEIKAVLSEQKIAGNTIWWIVYFAFPMISEAQGINDYAADRYSVVNVYGHRLEFSAYYSELDYDFDLEKWILQGKLLWIQQHDQAFKLHSMTEGCPYLQLDGHGKIQIIREGEVTWLKDIELPPMARDEALDHFMQEAIRKVNSKGATL